MRFFWAVLAMCLLPMMAWAEDRLVRLQAPDALVETGLLKHILPRFSLKSQVRVQIVGVGEAADATLGDTGTPLFFGIGQTWHLAVANPDHLGSKRFSDWMGSKVGQRAIIGFAPDGEALFGPPQEQKVAVVEVDLDGDAVLGQEVSRRACARCHAVEAKGRMGGIGSTPSFAVLRSLNDWEERFSVFYILNPHPSFTLIDEVTPPFPADRPSPIVPIELTLDELEAVLAYVGSMAAADLGGALVHQ